MIPARWLDAGWIDAIGFHATYAGVAEAQGAAAQPAVVWGRASAHVCLGQSQGRCEIDEAVAVPVVRRPLGGGAVWVDEDQLSYAIVAPRELAPRRPADWYGWALAPAIATFAAFGLAVTRNGEDLWLDGRKIAGSGAATIGRSAVVASSFLLRFPRRRFAGAVAARSAQFRPALAAALADAVTDWSSHAPPPGAELVARAFRRALGERPGWAVQRARLRGNERAAIAAWRTELAAPIEPGRPRLTGGIKLNAALALVCDASSGAPRLQRLEA